jgi:hypothetical protein
MAFWERLRKWSLQKLLLVSFGIISFGLFLIFIGVAFQYALNLDTTIIQFVIQVGGVLIGAGLVSIIIEYATMNDLIERISARIDRINKMEIEEFYEDRTKLMPLRDELKDYNVLWAAWHTGGVSSITGLINEYRSKTVRLVLMHPDDNETINSISKIANESVDQLKNQIRECTKKAKATGIDVKWYRGPIMHSVIIANPEPIVWKKSWARIEFLIPSDSVLNRPSMKVSNYRGLETLQKFIQWHKKMWEESEEPPADI